MKALFIAGEASGDLFGAELTGALRTLHPDVEAFGLGGPRMRRAGVRILRDTGAWGAIGVVNALRVLPRALEAYQALKRHLRHSPPDVLVPIDFGAFNVRAGRFARSLGIPVYYFIAPGSWRKTGPVSPELLQSADRFLSQLPWHAERLRAAGASADFFGHPLVDLARPSVPPQALRREWGVREGEAVVCILPGSRRHEVEHILPAFLDAGTLIRGQRPNTRFVLGLAEVVDRRQVERILRARGWTTDEATIAVGRTYDCLAVADAALCCSGTVTLEAAILGVPQVIVYRGSPGMRLQYQFVKHKIKYVGLPNLLLDAPVCPELLDRAASPEGIAAVGLALLSGGAEAEAQREAARRLRELLGRPGCIRQAAQRILEMGANRRG